MDNTVQQRIYIIFLLLFCVTLFASTFYYYTFDRAVPFLDCVYMTVVTLSTVGYGEVLDISGNNTAKIFTMLLMISGVGLVAYGFSLTTAFFVEGQLSDLWRRHRMEQQIAHLSDHYIVCGGGGTGLSAMEEFLKLDTQVVVIDSDVDRLAELALKTKNLFYIEGDSTEDEVLILAGIERAKGVLIALRSDKDNLFITVSARQLNPKIRIVSKGAGQKMKEKLQRAGADATVCPNLIGGLRMASEMVRPTVVSFLDLMLRDTNRTMRIDEIKISSKSSYLGKTLKESRLKENFDILVLAILEGDKLIYNPTAEISFTQKSTLIFMGDEKQVARMRKAF